MTEEPLALFSALIVIATGIVSVLGFRDRRVVERYLFDTQAVLVRRQAYRLLTSGLLHADWPHLLFNLFSFYSFAQHLELLVGPFRLLAIYVAAILGGNLLALLLHRHHAYRALGASGGVCGVIFASIFLLPGGSLLVFLLPVAIPSWLYAILFLVGSYVGMRRSIGNIGHDAHLGGAIVGLLVATAFEPGIVRASPWLYAGVMGLSAALFAYTYRWPLHLHAHPLSREAQRQRTRALEARNAASARAAEDGRIDVLLEKVSRVGLAGLTAAERSKLEASAARRRSR